MTMALAFDLFAEVVLLFRLVDGAKGAVNPETDVSYVPVLALDAAHVHPLPQHLPALPGLR